MIKLIHPLFYCQNKETYPPFKNGLYLEEYFFNFMQKLTPKTKKTYIPALWTNFQIEGWFPNTKQEMQTALNAWIKENENPNGYFTIIQYDDGPLLELPENTTVFGACSGNIPIPLIYEDARNTLLNLPKKSFDEKSILCSFVGNITSNYVTPNVRQNMFQYFQNNPNFKMINSGGWTPKVNQNLQQIFLDITVHSKFAFAPRGYGRSSFRFFECFQLGTIPVYIYNDVNWLPFQDKIDYDKLCIHMHVSQLDKLENILTNISNEQYQSMWSYYETIKHLFELEGMCKEIVNNVI